MRRLPGAAAAVLALAGALLAAPAAHAAPAYATGYHYYEGYADHPAYGAEVIVSFHATNSYYQVWVNGSVSCAGYGVRVTRCAWYGNGTNLGHAGVNYTLDGSAQWFQVNVYAPVWSGSVRCAPHGSAPVTVVTYCAA